MSPDQIRQLALEKAEAAILDAHRAVQRGAVEDLTWEDQKALLAELYIIADQVARGGVL